MIRGQNRQIVGVIKVLLIAFCFCLFFQTTSYSLEKQRFNIKGKVYYQGPGRIKKVVPLVPVKLIRVRRGKTMTFIESQTDKNGDFALRSSRPVVGGEYRIWVEFEKNGVVYRGMATKQVPDSKDFDLTWKLDWSADIICSPVGEIHEEKKEISRFRSPKKREKVSKKIEKDMLSMSHADLMSLARTKKPIFELEHKFIRARETKKAAAGGVDLILFLQGIQVPEEFLFETEARVHKTYHLTRWCPGFSFVFRKGKQRDYIHTTRNNIHFGFPQCRRREKTFDLLDYAVISRKFLWHQFHPKTEIYEPIPPGTVSYTFSQPILFFEKEWGKIGILKRRKEIFVFLDQKLIRQVPYSKPLGYFSAWVGYMDVEFRDLKVYPIKPRQEPCVATTPFQWPTDGGVDSLGQDYAQFNWGKVGHHHTGIDIGDRTERNVLATAKGEVIAICPDGVKKGCVFGKKQFSSSPSNHGFQGVVILKHLVPIGRTVYSLYGHLKTVKTFEPGQCIDNGELLGRTGGVPDNHLHFEIKDEPVLHNPIKYPKSCKDPRGKQSPKCWGYVYAHPERHGYYDPVKFLHRITGMPPVIRVTENDVNLRVGPGGIGPDTYRVLNTAGMGKYEALGLGGGTANPNCPAGWVQIRPKDGSAFPDTTRPESSIPNAWVCARFVSVVEYFSPIR